MTRTIHFGALLYEYQAIDVIGPLDLLHCASKEMMNAIKDYEPIAAETIAQAPEFVFHHIGETTDPVAVSHSMHLRPTTTIDECPELDCLLLGGPMSFTAGLSPKNLEFIQKHVAKGKLLFTNCTGAMIAAHAGVLDGKNATINNLAFRGVKENFPKVNWTMETKWVVDGNIWTACGAVAGMDMFSQWLAQEFGAGVMAEGAKALDFEPRDAKGVQNVLPKRYDADGKQLFTHAFHQE